MAVRSTMADLIARVRAEIGDPTGSGQTFSDQDIQDALDRRRFDVLMVPLRAVPTYPAGVAKWLDYYAPRGLWESDETLYDNARAVIAAGFTADRLIGHWTFAATQIPTVFITGKCYDIHAAAADLLEDWSAKEKLYHSFSGDEGESQEPSQRASSLHWLARTQRRKASGGPGLIHGEAAW